MTGLLRAQAELDKGWRFRADRLGVSKWKREAVGGGVGSKASFAHWRRSSAEIVEVRLVRNGRIGMLYGIENSDCSNHCSRGDTHSNRNTARMKTTGKGNNDACLRVSPVTCKFLEW